MEKTTNRQKMFVIVILVILLAAIAVSVISFFSGRGSKDAVGTCAGYDVTEDELRYVTFLCKQNLAASYGGDENLWEDPSFAEAHRAELESEILSEIKNNYAVLAAAKDYLSESELEDESLTDFASQTLEEFRMAYGDNLDEILESQHLTEDFLFFTVWVEAVQDKLCKRLSESGEAGNFTSETSFYDWIRDGKYVYVQHIFIANDPGEDVSENRRKAVSAREQLLLGTDIGELIGLGVSEDLSSVAPYFLIFDHCNGTVAEAARGLSSVGDISDVVETENGFFVFERMEEPDGVLEAHIPDLYEEDKDFKAASLIESYWNKISFEWTDYGREIDLVGWN